MSKRKKCPRCGAPVSWYQEIWNGMTLDFDVDEDGSIAVEGYLGEGNPVKVQAVCEKGCAWTVRGVTSINQLRKKLGQEEFPS